MKKFIPRELSNQFFKNRYKFFFKICYWKLKDYQLAEEATQNLILGFCKKRFWENHDLDEELKTGSAMNGYFTTSAINKCISFWQRRYLRSLASKDDSTILETLNSKGSNTVEETLIFEELFEKIKKFLLSNEARIWTKYIEGYRIKEIAESENIPPREMYEKINKIKKKIVNFLRDTYTINVFIDSLVINLC
jgi:DNA-directed RNA polymerase specialized sigma24 family protein